jgi:hypothetical protein
MCTSAELTVQQLTHEYATNGCNKIQYLQCLSNTCAGCQLPLQLLGTGTCFIGCTPGLKSRQCIARTPGANQLANITVAMSEAGVRLTILGLPYLEIICFQPASLLTCCSKLCLHSSHGHIDVRQLLCQLRYLVLRCLYSNRCRVANVGYTIRQGARAAYTD